MAKLSPVFNDQTFDANGNPASGYKLFTYVGNSVNTKQTTYTDEDGLTPQTNPIILNSLGWPTNGPIWLNEGQQTKFVLAPPTDTDPPTSPVRTIDNVSGVGDNTVSVSQWVSSGVSPVYVSANSFTLLGDQTSEFHKGRMLQLVTSGGTVYAKIVNSVFTSLTTVTVYVFGAGVLDAGLSVVNLSILTANNPSLPNPVESLRNTVAATATSTPIWDKGNGNIQDWTGTPTITDFPAAPQPGATRDVYPAPGTVITNAGNISIQGNANYTVASGDKLTITAVSTTTFYITISKKDGSSVIDPASLQEFSVVANTPANGLTITLPATAFKFRSPTLTSGTTSTVAMSAAATLVVSSGSTLGMASGVTYGLYVAAYLTDVGTVELAVCMPTGVLSLTEQGLLTSTAEGGAGGADSADIWYSTTAATNRPYKIVGYFRISEAVAGTYVTQPILVQGAGGNAVQQLAGFGFGCDWSVSAVTVGTTYRNTTSRPQYLSIIVSIIAGATAVLNVNGTERARYTNNGSGGGAATLFTFVSPNSTYSLTGAGVSLVSANIYSGA